MHLWKYAIKPLSFYFEGYHLTHPASLREVEDREGEAFGVLKQFIVPHLVKGQVYEPWVFFLNLEIKYSFMQ